MYYNPIVRFGAVKSTKHGFSLIEAIVALVVLSLVFTSVWGWFGTAATSTQRIESAVAMPEVFSQFIINLELESLEEVRNGQFVISDYEVNWTSIPQRQSNNETYRRQPKWIVTLFDVQADVTRNGKIISSFNTKTVRQWHDPDYIEPPSFN
jgi:prepilin-type N-terminal cleavage/methylation domain-containing protein